MVRVSPEDSRTACYAVSVPTSASTLVDVSDIDFVAIAKASSVVVCTSYSDEATNEDRSSIVVMGAVEVTRACCGRGVGMPVSSL